ncbi:MAG: hypothetical protein GF416_01745 [Candidatus Altiarchaeales archaeon]|nr:hypothetical protein [Candidatus Altiarchaeales archaeon]MBD3415839.1 hypothetical protein [Candidatus Altiarchaeales archaeon]
MAKVVSIAWFPRSYIHLFETFIGLKKVNLELEDVRYSDSLSFTIKSYKDMPDIRFTQDWSGLHYFTAEFPDDGVERSADRFMKEMQMLLVEKILRECHTMTYKQIVADIMPLDFHNIVLTNGTVETEGYQMVEAGSLKVAHRKDDDYYSGMTTYVMGSDDEALLKVLLFHAYTEVASDLMYSMIKAVTRLYHEADSIVSQLGASKDIDSLKEPMKVMDEIIKESSERYGKMEQVLVNYDLKEEEYLSLELTDEEMKLAEALGIEKAFDKIQSDGMYMEILWSDVLGDRLKNIDSTLDARVMMHTTSKKKGLF